MIIDKSDDEVRTNQVEMPLLVYVSRERRPPHPHHFKAGALNCLVFLCSSSFISLFSEFVRANAYEI